MITSYNNNKKDKFDLMFEVAESMLSEIDQLIAKHSKLMKEGKYDEAEKVLDQINDILGTNEEIQKQEVKEEKKSNKILSALSTLKAEVKSLFVKEQTEIKDEAVQPQEELDPIYQDINQFLKESEGFENLADDVIKASKNDDRISFLNKVNQLDQFNAKESALIIEMEGKLMEGFNSKKKSLEEEMSIMDSNFDKAMEALSDVAPMTKDLYLETLEEELNQFNHRMTTENLSFKSINLDELSTN